MNMFTTYCSGEVFLILHYVIKFVSDLRQVGGFSKYFGIVIIMKQTIGNFEF
jgi:hypothetical protein